eukprot:4687600-Pyramimonas_sp.AAC.1
MHEEKITMQDLRERFEVDTIRVYVGQRQMQLLGHIVRLPEYRLERRILFGWLSDFAECDRD